MEPSELNRYHKEISRHPLFRGIGNENFPLFQRYYQILSIPSGAQFLYEGEAADALYLLLEGEVSGSGSLFFSGDYWGLENLFRPGVLTSSFSAEDDSVVLRLKAESFRRMLKESSSLFRAFKPSWDDEGRLVKGVPVEFWKDIRSLISQREKKGALIHYKSRSSKKVYSVSLVFPLVLILAGYILRSLLPPALSLIPLGGIILFIQIVLRNLTLYKVSDKAVVSRYFDLKHFRQDQQVIPIDQIQTVTIATKGILSKIFRIGDLEVQTAGKGILFSGIDNPGRLQKLLMDLKSLSRNEERGREKENLRELIGQRFAAESADKILYTGDRVSVVRAEPPREKIFRKTLWVLVPRLLLPLSLIIIVSGILGFSSFGENPYGLYAGTAVIGMGFLRILWLCMDWWNDIYKIQFPHIWDIERKPLGKEDVRKQTELGMILNVTSVQKGLWQLFLNFGNVEIETAGRGEPLVFFSVKRPYEVQDELLTYREFNLRLQEQNRRRQAREDFLEYSEILEQTRKRDLLVRQRQGL